MLYYKTTTCRQINNSSLLLKICNSFLCLIIAVVNMELKTFLLFNDQLGIVKMNVRSDKTWESQKFQKIYLFTELSTSFSRHLVVHLFCT